MLVEEGGGEGGGQNLVGAEKRGRGVRGLDPLSGMLSSTSFATFAGKDAESQ